MHSGNQTTETGLRKARISIVVAILMVCMPVLGKASEPSIRRWIEQYSADQKTLNHRFQVPLDQEANQRRIQIAEQWLEKLHEQSFDELDRVAQTDYLLFRSELEYQIAKLKLDRRRDVDALRFISYWKDLHQICKRRENVDPIDARQLAGRIAALASAAEHAASELAATESAHPTPTKKTQERLDALRATQILRRFLNTITEAHTFYDGYDPQYSWWVAKPMQDLKKALQTHRTALREKMVGVPDHDQETIIGLPIGSDGLALELRHEWIAHSPEELVSLAKREMAWCESQLALASQELGFGDDWRAAMNHVKSKHVEPGQQPQMIRNLAWEAIRFLEANDLITVPPMAANGWRMTMMSPERQRLNPYFLGGDTIIVSFPTSTMTHEEKLMSMRSNNEHFSRATVHHELIPGHHLQYYMLPRYRPYRTLFSTPFWIEGWALYWEMLLWDLGFAQGPEDRVGMLFWRKHRCARIIFSLSYHLGDMSPEECIDYLVERVGHERAAATAEVRRSIMGGYSPLYQAAYMLGGLQLRSLHREMVLSGKMTNRQFHDAVIREHSIPIEILRGYLTAQELKPDAVPQWKFAEQLAE